MDSSAIFTISIAIAAFFITGINEKKIKKLEKRVKELERNKEF
ncbi:hypothetical protein MKY08_09855 [Lysinibacillus sp. FSL M8-0337]|nr:hypothetical protein [Lysinibacillus sphaericus]